ncbi:hypothetical protein [Paraglaciecola aestuariivivens]
MSTQNPLINRVSDVIEVLSAGADFYQFAIQNMPDEDQRRALLVMYRARKAAINELKPFIQAQSKQPLKGEHIAALLIATYQEVVGQNKICQGESFWPLLIELESKTLNVIDLAINLPQPYVCKQYLQRVRVSMQSCYDAFKRINAWLNKTKA